MGHMEYKLKKSLWEERSRELELFLGKSFAEIENDHLRILDNEKNFEEEIYTIPNERRITEYYSKTPRYLYELLHWESSFDKQDKFKLIYSFLSGRKIKEVLDFGGGIGGLSIFLAKRGIRCDYLDVRGKGWEFAEWRFKKNGLGVRMFDPFSDKVCGKYGAIVAYDVFEHLPDLKKEITRIAGMLREGGYLLAKSTFSGGGLHLKRNEEYLDMKKFNSLVSECGLDYCGRMKKNILGLYISPKEKYGGNFLVYQKKFN
jgi:2-polyprenyl-3-methyl-5-hydroxy-6-metoxy-1,4-benzoquinol methylase